MKDNRGFTLIETLVAGAILVCGLVAAASMFSFLVRVNLHNRQLIVATALLYDKMEEFRSARLTDPIWRNTTGSDQAGPDLAYTRVWEINPAVPRSLTVTVYGPAGTLTHRQPELIRATTLAGPVF